MKHKIEQSYDKSIIERSEDASNTKDEFAGTDLGTQRNDFLDLDFA